MAAMIAAGIQLTPAIDRPTKATSHHTATPSRYSGSRPASLRRRVTKRAKLRLISSATSSGSLSSRMSDVPEVAAAALAAGEAGGALLSLGPKRRRAEPALV